MSQAPHVLRGGRTGAKYGVNMVLEDSLATGLIDTYPTKAPMGITAEVHFDTGFIKQDRILVKCTALIVKLWMNSLSNLKFDGV